MQVNVEEVERGRVDHRSRPHDARVSGAGRVRPLRPEEPHSDERRRVDGENRRAHLVGPPDEVLVHHQLLLPGQGHVVGLAVAGRDDARAEVERRRRFAVELLGDELVAPDGVERRSDRVHRLDQRDPEATVPLCPVRRQVLDVLAVEGQRRGRGLRASRRGSRTEGPRPRSARRSRSPSHAAGSRRDSLGTGARSRWAWPDRKGTRMRR